MIMKVTINNIKHFCIVVHDPKSKIMEDPS